MTNKSNEDEIDLAWSESYYEERASEEEIYLEETEEELRIKLVSDTTQDDHSTRAAEIKCATYRELLAKILQG